MSLDAESYIIRHTLVPSRSGQAARARAVGIIGHEDDFVRFESRVSLEDVLTAAEGVLNAAVPATFRDETLERLAGSQLSESRKQLIFNYKLAFEGQLNAT